MQIKHLLWFTNFCDEVKQLTKTSLEDNNFFYWKLSILNSPLTLKLIKLFRASKIQNQSGGLKEKEP